jgi:hypothetical protein
MVPTRCPEPGRHVSDDRARLHSHAANTALTRRRRRPLRVRFGDEHRQRCSSRDACQRPAAACTARAAVWHLLPPARSTSANLPGAGLAGRPLHVNKPRSRRHAPDRILACATTVARLPGWEAVPTAPFRIDVAWRFTRQYGCRVVDVLPAGGPCAVREHRQLADQLLSTSVTPAISPSYSAWSQPEARRGIDGWGIKGLSEEDRQIILNEGLHPDGTPVGTIRHPSDPDEDAG